tara:strand:+ start:1038 stop:1919 length:882 start_codon:yes stop_codon:yes gene_type:complete
MDVDLNLNNYELDDLLKLFRLDYNFSNDELKKAKKIALKTHPDRSGLDTKYFIFFSKAYNIILNVYRFRCKRIQEVRNIDYVSEKMDEEEEKHLIKKLSKFKNVKDFNDWFNDVFEKVKVKDTNNDSGYGNWFKSDDDIDDRKLKNMSEMNSVFEKKKKETKAIVKHNGIMEMGGGGGYDLTRNRPNIYESDVFSKLQYEDLRKAHTETVVPVTMEDFYNKKRFDDLDSLKKHRDNSEETPLSLSQSKEYLNKRKEQEEIVNSTRAFNLIKRDREIEKSNQKFWTYLKQLENS